MYKKIVLVLLLVGLTLPAALAQSEVSVGAIFEAYRVKNQPRSSAEVMGFLDLTAGRPIVDVVLESGYYRLIWDADHSTLQVTRDEEAVEDLVFSVGEAAPLTFAGLFADGNPRVTGWMDFFEDILLVQLTAEGQSVRSLTALVPQNSGSDSLVVVIQEVCRCVGAPDVCDDVECSLETFCGNMLQGRCKWVMPPGGTPPRPTPPSPPPQSCGATADLAVWLPLALAGTFLLRFAPFRRRLFE